MFLIIFILGAIINRIRGGLLTSLYYGWLVARKGLDYKDAIEKAEDTLKTFSKHFNHIAFAIIFTLIINPDTWLQKGYCLILLSLGMLAGSSFGWGNYIGAMISGRIDLERTDAPIADTILFKFKKNTRLAGFLALSFRGMIWTYFLAISFAIMLSIDILLPLKIFFIVPCGLLMGTFYLLAMKISAAIYGERYSGWQIGEILFGGYLWSTIYFLLVG